MHDILSDRMLSSPNQTAHDILAPIGTPCIPVAEAAAACGDVHRPSCGSPALQYAPMATRLAGAGVLTVVMHYSLFPGALVPEMVDEVSAALSWTLNHCATLGGDPARVRSPASCCLLLHSCWVSEYQTVGLLLRLGQRASGCAAHAGRKHAGGRPSDAAARA